MIKNTLIIAVLLFLGDLVLSQEHGTVKTQNKITRGLGLGGGLVSIGDLNQDYTHNLIIGRPKDFEQEVIIAFLDSNGQIQSETSIQSNTNGFNTTLGGEDQFGSAIANLGDVDGDGIPDIAVGAPGASYSGLRKGAVWLLFLNRDGTVKDYRKIDDNSSDFNFNINQEEYFGSSLGTLMDWNGNGIKELLVGSSSRKDSGGFWILSLDNNGQIVQQQEFNAQKAPFSNFKLNSLGSSINGIGYIKQDGFPDMIVGDGDYMPENNDEKGAIFTLFLEKGSQGEVQIKNIKIITQNKGGLKDTLARLSLFGSSVVKLGDVNGDTIKDIAVGAYGERYPKDTSANFQTGKVRILFMNNKGTVKDFQPIGNNLGNFQDSLKTGDFFGLSLARISDLNGDRVPELAVGAPGHGGNQKGSVFILFLNGVPQSSGIDEDKPVRRLQLYPNPLSNSRNVTVKLPTSFDNRSAIKVTVYTMQGRQVHEAHYGNSRQSVKVKLPKLAKGTYQLFLKAGEFQGFSKIVVK